MDEYSDLYYDPTPLPDPIKKQIDEEKAEEQAPCTRPPRCLGIMPLVLGTRTLVLWFLMSNSYESSTLYFLGDL